MGSKRESLNKRIRETITSLSDEKLNEMQLASDTHFTAYARKVLEQELSRRRKKVVQDAVSRNNSCLPAVSEEPARGEHAGCYVEVWSEKNFAGEKLRIEGPGEYQALEITGQEWGNTISSLRVGPGAFVLVYSGRDFEGNMFTFGPNQEVMDLDQVNVNDEIDSINVASSFKIFDQLRSEPAVKTPVAPETKRTARRGRRKS